MRIFLDIRLPFVAFDRSVSVRPQGTLRATRSCRCRCAFLPTAEYGYKGIDELSDSSRTRNMLDWVLAGMPSQERSSGSDARTDDGNCFGPSRHREAMTRKTPIPGSNSRGGDQVSRDDPGMKTTTRSQAVAYVGCCRGRIRDSTGSVTGSGGSKTGWPANAGSGGS